MGAAPKTLRATTACARCRRQKLKCDSKKPCTLCLHAGQACEPQTAAERSRLNHKRLSQSRAQARSAVEPTSSAQMSGGLPIPLPAEGSVRLLDASPLQEHQHDVSPLSLSYSNHSDRRLYSAVNSSMDFAKTVIGDSEINEVGGDDSAQADAELRGIESRLFQLVTISSISREVLHAGIEAYFDRFHWFVMLLHEPLFVQRASSILSRSIWQQHELCDVILVLMVSILGLKCASNDSSWKGHQVLQAHSVNARDTVNLLLKEVGVHFYNVMMQSKLEAYQIVMLLEIYHVYFGSLNFARHLAGVPARVAYGLNLHCDEARNMDETAYQVGIRCWNHAVVGELFAAMIYGQPSSLDPEFSRFRSLSELDETAIPRATAALPIIATSRRTVTALTFHTLKFELYEVIQGILQQFKTLHSQNPITVQDLKAAIQAVELVDAKLKQWRDHLPPAFDPVYWGDAEPWEALQVDDMDCTPEDRSCRRKLALQGIILQVLHDSTVILAHRPLLQSRISICDNIESELQLQHAPDSLRISAEAALRISRRPTNPFKHQLALSFFFVHSFTAGVILCVPPINLPYSALASESKAGVLRIISASRAMSSSNSIARHTDQILTKLYRKTIQREMDSALTDPVTENTPEPPQPRTPTGFMHRAGPPADFGPPNMPTISSTSQASTVGAHLNDNAAPVQMMSTNYSIDPQQQHPQPLSGSFNEPFNPSAPTAVPYLQFGSLFQDDSVDSSFLSEHLDDAFGAFDQMYDLSTMGGLAGDIFGPGDAYSGM